MKFIHIADVHYGVQPEKDHSICETRTREIKETFQEVIQVAEEQKVDLLLIAGDLFHMPPTQSMLQEVDYLLCRLSKTRTVIIAGNHDYMAKGSPYEQYRFKSNTIAFPAGVVNHIYCEDINTCITGISYRTYEWKERIYDTLKPKKEGAINILLGHGGDESHIPIDVQKLSMAGFNYVALGHIHKPGVLVANQIAYSGALEPIHCGDTGTHGYIYGEIDEHGTKLVFQPFAKRQYITLSLELDQMCTGEEVIDAVEQEIIKLGAQNLYRIVMRGACQSSVAPDFHRLCRSYEIISIQDESHPDISLEQLYQENQNNLLGKYIARLRYGEDLQLPNGEVPSKEVVERALQFGIKAMLETGER